MKIMGLLFTGVMAGQPFWGPSISARTSYQRQPEMRGTFAGAITDEGITLQTLHMTQNIQWTLYNKMVRSQNIVLLYQNAQCFNFFPRSFFSTEEDWQALQSLLDSKIAKGEMKDQSGKSDFGTALNLPRRTVFILIIFLLLCIISAIAYRPSP